ncbi:MAG: hypothetical protein FWG30_04170 [Eubacteriaceae bacterium]|nr:hypothetical protein [Eubacteriaceae bacterium]
MANKYFLMSKDIGNGPLAIGELERIGIRKYRFSYSADKGDQHTWLTLIPGLDSNSPGYSNRKVKKSIFGRLIPKKGTWRAKKLSEQFGIAKYNEWDLLECLINQHEALGYSDLPLCDSHQIFYIYKQLPAKAACSGCEGA